MNINPNSFITDQLRIFMGIPSPTNRWKMLKLMFYKKLIEKPDYTILHKWAANELDDDIPFMNEFRKLINKYIPNATKDDIRSQEKPWFRQGIINSLTNEAIRSLPKFHPFKTIKFTANTYQSFNM